MAISPRAGIYIIYIYRDIYIIYVYYIYYLYILFIYLLFIIYIIYLFIYILYIFIIYIIHILYMLFIYTGIYKYFYTLQDVYNLAVKNGKYIMTFSHGTLSTLLFCCFCWRSLTADNIFICIPEWKCLHFYLIKIPTSLTCLCLTDNRLSSFKLLLSVKKTK